MALRGCEKIRIRLILLGFFRIFNLMTHPQRPTCRFGWGRQFEKTKKTNKSKLNFNFFTASESLIAEQPKKKLKLVDVLASKKMM
jgi:hypothetical protein